MEELGAISTQLHALARELSEFRGEMRAATASISHKQDMTNGRVTSLEGRASSLEARAAAHDAHAPAIAKALDELAEKKASDHERIWKAIEALKAHDDEGHAKAAHEEGWRGGAAKVGSLLWMLVLAAVAALGWIIERVVDWRLNVKP